MTGSLRITLPMKRFEFHLDISSQHYLHYYRGSIRLVHVQCSNGISIQFPASLLIPFVSVSGIHGDFVLTCNEDHKNSRLRHLASP